MQIEVTDNPNCRGCEQYYFTAMEPAKPIRGIKTGSGKDEAVCDVAGVDAGGRWIQAFAQKVTDSGSGFAYLIYGGTWGIRLKPRGIAQHSWSLTDRDQWGECYKLYGEETDIEYGAMNAGQ